MKVKVFIRANINIIYCLKYSFKIISLIYLHIWECIFVYNIHLHFMYLVNAVIKSDLTELSR